MSLHQLQNIFFEKLLESFDQYLSNLLFYVSSLVP